MTRYEQIRAKVDEKLACHCEKGGTSMKTFYWVSENSVVESKSPYSEKVQKFLDRLLGNASPKKSGEPRTIIPIKDYLGSKVFDYKLLPPILAGEIGITNPILLRQIIGSFEFDGLQKADWLDFLKKTTDPLSKSRHCKDLGLYRFAEYYQGIAYASE